MDKEKVLSDNWGFEENSEFISLNVQFNNKLAANDETNSAQDEQISGIEQVNADQTAAIEGTKTVNEEQSTKIAEAASINAAQAEQIEGLENRMSDVEEAVAGIPSVDGLATETFVNDSIAEAIAPLAVEADVERMVNDKIAEVVDGAPAAFDTLKEIATYIENNDAKADSMVAAINEVQAALPQKADKSELADFATKQEVEAVSATLADKADKAYVDGVVAEKADASDVEEALNAKADKSELTDFATTGWVESHVAEQVAEKPNKAEVTAQIAEAVNPLAVKADVDAELANKVNKEELSEAIAPLAVKADIEAAMANKVDWVESENGRKHVVLKNHDSVLGTALNGSTYNLAMVSKWDVADFGSAQLHLNLNSKDGMVTINDDKAVATQDYVTEAVAALPTMEYVDQAAADAVANVIAGADENFDTLKEIADFIKNEASTAVEMQANIASNTAALENKADKSDLDAKADKAEVDARFDALDIPSIEGLAKTTEVDAAIAAAVSELNAKDAEQDSKIAGKTDRDVMGANGKALMFNETDGGGAKFEHNDGTWSFVGVNDGGENGIAGQVYALKKNEANKMEGVRLDITKGAIYYTVGDASVSERLVANNELTVKADLLPITEVLAAKADAAHVYTQEEVDALMVAKAKEIYNLTKIVGDMGGAVTYQVPNEMGVSFNSIMTNNGTVKLSEDLTTGRFGPGIFAKNKVTLNLNGHDLTCTNAGSYGVVLARNAMEVTITGKGTIDAAGGICVQASGENAVVNLTGSTTIYRTNRNGELIYCYQGTINISNGTFRNDGESNKFLLNCYDANYKNGTAQIIVTGGKFYDWDPANNDSEGAGTSYVPEGYVSTPSTVVEDGVEHTVYTVKKA